MVLIGGVNVCAGNVCGGKGCIVCDVCCCCKLCVSLGGVVVCIVYANVCKCVAHVVCVVCDDDGGTLCDWAHALCVSGENGEMCCVCDV